MAQWGAERPLPHRTPWGDGGDTAEPGSVFAYEPGALNGAPHRGAGCAHRDPISPPQPPGAVPAVPPIEVRGCPTPQRPMGRPRDAVSMG